MSQHLRFGACCLPFCFYASSCDQKAGEIVISVVVADTCHSFMLKSLMLLLLKCCFTSTETIRLIRDGSPGRLPRLSHSS